MAQWAEAIREAVPPAGILNVVDLGCGTGRFTQLLAGVYDAEIVGIDPSQKMLAQAERLADNHHIRFLSGPAESIPLPDQSADLLFLSMVWHHIEDKDKAFFEFARVLRRPGYVVLRTATTETNEEIECFRSFPEALETERRRTSTRNELKAEFEKHDFTTHAELTVPQKFAGSPAEYYQKISLRNLSSLQGLPDDVFHTGLARFQPYCESLRQDHPIYEPVDLFAFKLEA